MKLICNFVDDFADVIVIYRSIKANENIREEISRVANDISLKYSTDTVRMGLSIEHDLDMAYEYREAANTVESIEKEIAEYLQKQLVTFGVYVQGNNPYGFVIGVDFKQDHLYVAKQDIEDAQSLKVYFDEKVYPFLKTSSIHTCTWEENADSTYLMFRASDGHEFYDTVVNADSVFFQAKRLFAEACLHIGIPENDILRFLLSLTTFEKLHDNEEELRLVLEIFDKDFTFTKYRCVINRISTDCRTVNTIVQSLVNVVRINNKGIDFNKDRCYNLSLQRESNHTGFMKLRKADNSFNSIESLADALCSDVKEMLSNNSYGVIDDTDSIGYDFSSAINKMAEK